MEKYFNDAIIGNQNITASFTKKGELIRLLYPCTDYKQFIDFYHMGLKINDSNIIYLHDDINNIYDQYYTEGTNILNTEIFNTYFKLKILQTDFVCIKENVLVRRFKFTNENVIDLDLNLLVHSKLISTDNNQVSGLIQNDALLQYMHDYTVCTFSKNKFLSTQINNTSANIFEGQIGDKDYVGMSTDSSVSYDLGILKPNEEKIFETYIYIDENKGGLYAIDKTIERIKKIDFKVEYENTKKYWRKYLKKHDGLNLDLTTNMRNIKIMEIYNRTILLFPLLTNSETGGVSAAIETDEKLTKCGRYTYCWPRDAVFIANAMDILQMQKEVEKFYKVFCKNTQARDGMWQQRFFTDGKLAPSWGYQIDETAAVVYGVYEHYLKTQDKKFLKDTLKMTEKATKILTKYIEDIMTDEGKFHVSYDIWEMYEGKHLYSIANIYSAFDSMIKIYEELKEEFVKNRIKQENVNKEKEILREELVQIKDYCLKNFYDEEKKSFVRNLEDRRIDISILGTVVPFKMFTAKEKRIINTVERINMTIRTYTGGYQRFEKDHYMGGNPWVIANLWMANYYIESGENKKARECFDFVLKTSAKHGYLAEQIDNKTMSPAWIIGLGWSHAMFIITLQKMIEKGLIK